ncbi:exodeoxyribonuclease V subunit gamma [Marinomonas sp. C2222]|uniref:RecBCD enzyme subunit RecC n=1 Tax=Marinomonas sargassi TaxID=2984494 RepID=A0ABT2YN31_9GAMM|nr:exodeoxyribonuclease V subunit gamma [Marinomonas sargassi]MCV2401286.1 exodeoxyribonuclease V subunit gamma [Marinomonas sargassi]
MFQLYTGNRLEDLAVLLAKILAVSPPDNPFDDEHILVQNPGMAQWLKIFLAQSHSISAGLAFPLPSTFIWQTFSHALDDIPSQSEFNKPFLVWRLMRLLDSRLQESEFQPLKWYLEEDDTQVRRFQLCSNIADIYDQYLVYRPDWIKAWEANHIEDPALVSLFEQQAWQAILWRDLVADVSEQGTSLYHRGNLIEALQEACNSSSRPAGVPARIFIFGVSSMPPNTLESLRVLAESGWIDVHLFLQNPCRFYWGDVVDKHYLGREIKRSNAKPNLSVETLHLDANPLLASWGRLGRDYIAQLQEMANNEITIFEDYIQGYSEGINEGHIEGSSQGQQSSLLQYVQQDVLSLENHGSKQDRDTKVTSSEYRHPIKEGDDSIRVHLCHSPLREVEVLHDQLLDMFEKNPQLTPKDVIVMLPDVNAYSPFVKAVFGQTAFAQVKDQSNTKKQIPFTLIDQSGGMENPIVDAYLYLLGLGESRFTLSELISVLEVPAVLARFDLTAEELERIRQWAAEVGVRWGLDGSTAEQHDLPIQEVHTWLNGIRRMLLGYAMGHDHIWEGTLSYGDVEGLEASIAGKLADFLVAINEAQARLMTEMLPKEWATCLHFLAERFFELPEDDVFLNLLGQQLDTLISQWQMAHFDAPLDQQVMRQLLTPMLQESQGSQRFLAGRVNFCTLMPMRSVPFKVICVLGLNEGDYPRSVAPMGFDLMVGQYRSGDRSRREDDKYLFLEALMSARECFYISYVGRSIQDNSEKNPSILASELLEYIGQSCAYEADLSLPPEEAQKSLLKQLILEHPLQPFNASYYLGKEHETVSADKRLYSYDEQWLPALLTNQEEEACQNLQPLEGLEQLKQELALDEVSRFVNHPARYFTQRRLKAFLTLREEEEYEDEPFALDGLAGYQLREALLNAMLEKNEERFLEQLSLTGALPYGAIGHLSLQKNIDSCRQLLAELNSYGVEETPPIEVNLSLGHFTLQAWLPMASGHIRLSYRVGDVSAHQKMLTWIEHLALSAQGTPKRHCLINLVPKKGIVTQEFLPLLPEDAKGYLSEILALLQKGLCLPLALPAKSADAWCKSYCSAKAAENPELAWESALKIYQESSSAFSSSEVDDAYWQRYYPDLSPQKDTFMSLCESVWLPLHRHLEEVK